MELARGGKVLPAPFQSNNLLDDVLLYADRIEISEYLSSELPEFDPTFSRQEVKPRIDPVLESGRNVLVKDLPQDPFSAAVTHFELARQTP